SKKLETELQALMDSNARLTDTLQEANSNAESWKSKVTQSQDENNQLRNKVKKAVVLTRNAQLSLRIQELEADLQEKEQFCMLFARFTDAADVLQAAETASRDQSEKMTLLQSEIDDSQHKQKNMKTELKKFMDVLDGKIDELHEVRQGFSKLGVDN
uniref:Homer protein homolog 2-like n=1 Tax=Sinocyclocheilus rhinocerous TaxID=307959 RepID=A0A673JED1_9TELE